jgi:2-polyprenyl-3-methyl-5-hydroxy-6-metoxy-1,4-benzoquinol methylase
MESPSSVGYGTGVQTGLLPGRSLSESRGEPGRVTCGRYSTARALPYLHDLPASLDAGARVCLYGAGGVGLGQKRLLNMLRPDVTVVAFADSVKTGLLDGVPIWSPAELAAAQDRVDLTIVTSDAWDTIARTLAEHGVAPCVRFCGLPEFVPFPDVPEAPTSVCQHDWRPYPAGINRYRQCQRCGAIHKYLVAGGERPSDDYNDAYWHVTSIVNGVPQNRTYERECLEALAAIGRPLQSFGRTVLEVGAGTGRLVPMFLRHGFEYTALEPSTWAATFITETFSVPVLNCGFEQASFERRFDLVVSIHTLEHLVQADVALERLAALAKPGGYVFLVVPDGEDLFNRDHVWFFDERVLRHWCAAAGLDVLGTTRLRPNPREDNIYLVARRD